MKSKTALMKDLQKLVENLYKKNQKDLPFHGYHHIYFVYKKSLVFAKAIKADQFLVGSAALVHDLNYIVKKDSGAGEGGKLRKQLLEKAGYSTEDINRIEEIVLEAETAYRGHKISKEGMAFSDGDSLFKALPITPLVFTSKYVLENNVDLAKLAGRIISDQKPLLDKNIFFYTKLAKTKYLNWIKTQMKLIELVAECMKDKDVQKMLEISKNF